MIVRNYVCGVLLLVGLGLFSIQASEDRHHKIAQLTRKVSQAGQPELEVGQNSDAEKDQAPSLRFDFENSRVSILDWINNNPDQANPLTCTQKPLPQVKPAQKKPASFIIPSRRPVVQNGSHIREIEVPSDSKESEEDDSDDDNDMIVEKPSHSHVGISTLDHDFLNDFGDFEGMEFSYQQENLNQNNMSNQQTEIMKIERPINNSPVPFSTLDYNRMPQHPNIGFLLIPNFGARNIGFANFGGGNNRQPLPQNILRARLVHPPKQDEQVTQNKTVTKKRKAPTEEYRLPVVQNRTDIPWLPPELWGLILYGSTLDHKSIGFFSRTCKTYYLTVNSWCTAMINNEMLSTFVGDLKSPISPMVTFCANGVFLELLLRHRDIIVKEDMEGYYYSFQHQAQVRMIQSDNAPFNKRGLIPTCATFLVNHLSRSNKKGIDKQRVNLLKKLKSFIATNNDPNMKMVFNYILSLEVSNQESTQTGFTPFAIDFDEPKFTNSAYIKLIKYQTELSQLREVDAPSVAQWDRIFLLDPYPTNEDYQRAAKACRLEKQFSKAKEHLRTYLAKANQYNSGQVIHLKNAAIDHFTGGDIEGAAWCWEQAINLDSGELEDADFIMAASVFELVHLNENKAAEFQKKIKIGQLRKTIRGYGDHRYGLFQPSGDNLEQVCECWVQIIEISGDQARIEDLVDAARTLDQASNFLKSSQYWHYALNKLAVDQSGRFHRKTIQCYSLEAARAHFKAGKFSESSFYWSRGIDFTQIYDVNEAKEAAKAHELAGKWIEAGQCWEAIIERLGDEVTVDELQSAISIFEKAGNPEKVAQYKNELEVLYLRLQATSADKKLKPAEKMSLWKKVIEKSGDRPYSSDLKAAAIACSKASNFADSSKYWKFYLQVRKYPQLQDLKDAAKSHEKAGNWVEASECWQHIIEMKKKPNDKELRSAAIAATKAGKWDDACDCWHKLGNLSDTERLLAAVAFTNNKEWDDAVSHWQHLVEKPSVGMTDDQFHLAAMAFAMTGNALQACQCWEVIMTNSLNKMTLDDLRMAGLAFTSIKNWVAAQVCQDRLIQMTSNNPNVADLRDAATVCENLMQFGKAAVYRKQAEICTLRSKAKEHSSVGDYHASIPAWQKLMHIAGLEVLPCDLRDAAIAYYNVLDFNNSALCWSQYMQKVGQSNMMHSDLQMATFVLQVVDTRFVESQMSYTNANNG